MATLTDEEFKSFMRPAVESGGCPIAVTMNKDGIWLRVGVEQREITEQQAECVWKILHIMMGSGIGGIRPTEPKSILPEPKESVVHGPYCKCVACHQGGPA